MNLQHVVIVNERLHEVQSANGNRLVLGSGKQFATVNFESKQLIHRHVLTGRFRSTKVR